MNTINNYNNSQIQFQGRFNLRKLPQTKTNAAMISANILSVPEQEIIEIAKQVSDKKWDFFTHLTEKFNGINYYRTKAEKENPEIVKEIFDAVEKPRTEHFTFVSQYDGSLDNIKRIFDSAKNNKKNLRFAIKINADILANNPQSNQNLIPDLLESPNCKEYIKNYEKYKPYLELNSENPNAVKDLDTLISSNKYDENVNNIKLELRKKNYPFVDTENFNRDLYAKSLNSDNKSIMDALQGIGLFNNMILKNGGDKALKEIFLSTNSKNIKSRIDLAWQYNEGTAMSTDEKVLQLEMLNIIFGKMDNDKHITNFVNHMLKKLNTSNLSLKELDMITNKISALKLDIFKKNAMRVINNSAEGSRVETLENEIENPFYESYNARMNRLTAERYGFRKKSSFLSKTMTKIQNQFKIWEYRLKSINENSVVAQNEINPVEIKPTEITPIKVAPDVITPESVIENKTTIIKESNAPKIKENISPKVNKKAERDAAKAQVKQNIFDIISSKLGLKTLEKQQEAFGANATKMRLSLLPEIFASIAETRKADKAVGKLKINSSNKDALDLYLLINGSNKKYINYLLKKRNADNTRMFEVKDIIANVRKAENKIAANKKANPNYRANDARKYYNHLYESKLQQYGKVKRPTRQMNTSV